MSTKIEWTEHTWNPVVGCTRVSEGCRYCYAEFLHNMRHKAFTEGKLQDKPQYAKPFSVVQTIPERLSVSLGKAPTVWFVNSVSDLFHEDLEESFIRQVFDVMVRWPQHIFQILTKRADRLAEMAPRLPWPENVWMGVTVEDGRVVKRVEYLRQVQAFVRFLSCEPLIGPLDDLALEGIDWVIVGGESNSKSYGDPATGKRVMAKVRPMDIAWARSIRDRCEASGAAFFFKHYGDWANNPDAEKERAYWNAKKATQPTADSGKGGKLLDGHLYQNYPIDMGIWRSEGKAVKTLARKEMSPQVLTHGFDYVLIEGDDRRSKVRDAAKRIRAAQKTTVVSLISIGAALIEVKEVLVDHGQWLSWLESEFDMSVRTAQNYVAVAKRMASPENASLAFLPSEALYLLAPPKVPEEAVQAVRSRLAAGERLGVEEVRQVIAEHRPGNLVEVPVEVADVNRLTRLVRKAVFDMREDDFAAGFKQLPPEERKEAISAVEMLLEMVRDADQAASDATG